MFHSLGTVQSKTWVPVGTSLRVNGMWVPIIRSVSRRQLDGDVLAESSRRIAQVDNDVEDGTGCTAHQFGLSKRLHLVMHPPQRSSTFVKGNVALRDMRIHAALGKFLATERASEET